MDSGISCSASIIRSDALLQSFVPVRSPRDRNMEDAKSVGQARRLPQWDRQAMRLPYTTPKKTGDGRDLQEPLTAWQDRRLTIKVAPALD